MAHGGSDRSGAVAGAAVTYEVTAKDVNALLKRLTQRALEKLLSDSGSDASKSSADMAFATEADLPARRISCEQALVYLKENIPQPLIETFLAALVTNAKPQERAEIAHSCRVKSTASNGSAASSESAISVASIRYINGQYVDCHGAKITDPVTLAHAAEALDFQREQVSGKHPSHARSPHGLMLEPPQDLPVGTLYKLAIELGKIDRTGLPPALSGGSTMSAVLLAFQAAVAYALLTIDGANEGDMWGPPDTVSNIATDSFATASTVVSAIANWLILHRVINGDVINSHTSAIGQISRGEVSFIEAGNGIRAVLRATAGTVGWYLAFINALPFMYAGHKALGTISDVTGIRGTSWNMVVAGMDGFNQALRTALVARSIQAALSTVCNWRPRYTGLLCGRENPSWRADQVVTLLAANTRRVLKVYKQQRNIKALLAVSESLTKCRGHGQSDLALVGWMMCVESLKKALMRMQNQRTLKQRNVLNMLENISLLCGNKLPDALRI